LTSHVLRQVYPNLMITLTSCQRQRASGWLSVLRASHAHSQLRCRPRLLNHTQSTASGGEGLWLMVTHKSATLGGLLCRGNPLSSVCGDKTRVGWWSVSSGRRDRLDVCPLCPLAAILWALQQAFTGWQRGGAWNQLGRRVRLLPQPLGVIRKLATPSGLPRW
jgi:hypothetical protein